MSIPLSDKKNAPDIRVGSKKARGFSFFRIWVRVVNTWHLAYGEKPMLAVVSRVGVAWSLLAFVRLMHQ